MDINVNFYELREELNALGFTDTAIADQLRQGMYEGQPFFTLYNNNIPVGGEFASFELNFELDRSQRISFCIYSGNLTVSGDKRSALRFQNFHPDVPFERAIYLLQARSKFPELDEIAVFSPITFKEVEERLQIYAAPVPINEKFRPVKEELKNIGFTSPDLIDGLRQKLLDRQERFYLQTLIKSEQADFLYTLNFRPDSEGQVELYYYTGLIQPHDQITQRLIGDEPDAYPRSVNFETDVPQQNATQYLNTWLPLKKNGVETEIPVTREMVITTININNNQMNTQNLDFLKKSLLNLGFGEQVNKELEKNMNQKLPEFNLQAQHEFNQQKANYNLHFKAGENQEMYFLNKFDATLKKGTEKEQNQTFYINKGNGVTAKEAFNLMEGRAVHKQLFNKEGEKYHAWLQLDDKNLTQNGSKEIKRFSENYGFDIEQVISGKDIKEMKTAEGQDNLLRSLKKGNAQQITVEHNGEEKKYFIAASPQFKTVDLYDHQMKKIKREELLNPEHKPGNSKKQSQQQRQELPEKKQRVKRKISV